MTIDEIVTKLDGVETGQDGFVAKCPGHDDAKGSLTIRASGGRILLRCSAGCSTAEVLGILGLEGVPVDRDPNLFIVRTIDELIEDVKNTPDPDMLFGEFWFEGELCILFADTNVGKSILAVQIGDLISRGNEELYRRASVTQEDRPGCSEPRPPLVAHDRPGTACFAKRVLYLDFEMNAQQFAARVGDDMEHHWFDDNFVRAEPTPERADWSRFRTYQAAFDHYLEKAIVETEAQVLIVDNLTYLGDEMENASSALPLMKRLKELKSRHNLSMLVLAHTPKRDESKPLGRNDLQGSSMLINFCDSAFVIGESLQDRERRYLKQVKARNVAINYNSDNVLLARIDRIGGLLQFVFEGTGSEYFHLRIPSPEETERRKADLRAKIAKCRAEGLSLRDIAAETGVSHMTVKRYLEAMT